MQRLEADHDYDVKKRAEAREKRREEREEREERRRVEREERRDVGEDEIEESEESEEEEEEEPEFDQDNAWEAVVEEVPDGGKYVYGISVAYNTTRATFEAFHPVDLNDGCHLHSLTNGTMFVTVMQDADRHLVPLMETLLLDNERKETWDIHNTAINKCYTKEKFDTLTRRRVIDGDKGEIASMQEHTELGNWFACEYHLGKGVSTRTGRGGAVAKKLYKRAVHATSIPGQ